MELIGIMKLADG